MEMIPYFTAGICILLILSIFISFVTSLYILNSKDVNEYSKGMNLFLVWVLPFYWSYRFMKQLKTMKKAERGDDSYGCLPFGEIIFTIFDIWN